MVDDAGVRISLLSRVGTSQIQIGEMIARQFFTNTTKPTQA